MKKLKFYLSVFLVVFSFAETSATDNPSLETSINITQILSEPISVTRKNGSVFEGTLDLVDEQEFSLSQRLSNESEVTVRFSWEEVYSVQFPGDVLLGHIRDNFEAGDWKSVNRLMLPIFQQRVGFFRILSERSIREFKILAESFLNVGDPAKSLGVVKKLKPWLPSRVNQMEIENIELLAYLELGLSDEAHRLANEKIESALDAAEASLAWIAVALEHLNRGNYRQAWLASIHPILFDKTPQSQNRADAFLIASIANLRLNRPRLAMDYRNQLLEENFKLLSKPYQAEWFQVFQSIDWKAISDNEDEIEAFADLEASIAEATDISENDLPVLKIPLEN